MRKVAVEDSGLGARFYQIFGEKIAVFPAKMNELMVTKLTEMRFHQLDAYYSERIRERKLTKRKGVVQ